jgi:hypothetical protein
MTTRSLILLLTVGCTSPAQSPQGKPCTSDADCGQDVCAASSVCEPASVLRDYMLTYSCAFTEGSTYQCIAWPRFEHGSPCGPTDYCPGSVSFQFHILHCYALGTNTVTVTNLPFGYDSIETMYNIYLGPGGDLAVASRAAIVDLSAAVSTYCQP